MGRTHCTGYARPWHRDGHGAFGRSGPPRCPLCQRSCRPDRIGPFGGVDIRKWLDTDRRTRIGSWRDCCRRAVRPWSRCLARVIGFEVHDSDSAEHAAHLARRTALAEGLHAMPTRPVLHGDNGASLKATMVLAMLHWLGIRPSHSRPRVSDDNAFAGRCSELRNIVRSSHSRGCRSSGARKGNAVLAVVEPLIRTHISLCSWSE